MVNQASKQQQKEFCHLQYCYFCKYSKKKDFLAFMVLNFSLQWVCRPVKTEKSERMCEIVLIIKTLALESAIELNLEMVSTLGKMFTSVLYGTD